MKNNDSNKLTDLYNNKVPKPEKIVRKPPEPKDDDKEMMSRLKKKNMIKVTEANDVMSRLKEKNTIKVIEINDGEVTDVIDMKVSDEVWNDKLELWYEYNKRYDDVGREEVLAGWKVSRLGNVMVVNDKDGYEMVVFMRN